MYFKQTVPSGPSSSTGGSDLSGKVLNPSKMGTGHEQAAEETLVTNNEWTGLLPCHPILNHEQGLNSVMDYIQVVQDIEQCVRVSFLSGDLCFD